MKIDKNIIKELTDYLNEFNLTEIEYTDKDTKIKVSKSNPTSSNQVASVGASTSISGEAKSKDLNINLEFSQSNIEGEIVTTIQEAKNKFDGIIINAAGFTHTSVAIRDALDIYKKPIIELHISNIYKREEFRHKSLISDIATGGIFGLGDNGYILAIIAMQNILKNENR